MRTDRLRLQDILEACEVIQQYTPEQRSQFDADPPVRSHILFHIQVIGEPSPTCPAHCAKRIPKYPGSPLPACATSSPTSISA